MKSRPILFSGSMVRAILDGSKTQTRRIVKPQLSFDPSDHSGTNLSGKSSAQEAMEQVLTSCPYGQPGDQLWVRETWRCGWSEAMSEPFLQYQADGEIVIPETSARHNDMAKYLPDGTESTKPSFRPSIHLPRWGSRITLEITGIRVERLREISEGDAMYEGAGFLIADHEYLDGNPDQYRRCYEMLWESINGPGSWGTNPWVWVVTFKRIEGGDKWATNPPSARRRKRMQ